ncbi:MAG: cellulase family glycosylhydrolase [Oscillospiraceae bacterium]|nr:cellulase family glycosylhydrolase [Oscillospiraceae bacterium]
MKFKKIVSAITSAVLIMTASVTSLTTVNSADDGVMRDITTMELVRDMGVGINLGNTMESCGDWIAQWGAGGYAAGTVESYEVAWGSPVITKDVIDGYASEGFGVVRIPVAWSNLMGDNYQISDEYFARVKQLVDWVIDADMYAVINIHYDSGWMNNLPTDPDGCKNRFKAMWEQIADYFKDYSDYLMFESQNEELGWDSIWNQWSGTAEQKAQSYAYVNEVNQLFVDTIRASGGNNDERHLLISGYKTDITLTCDTLFEMPDDPANRCAVSVHYYTPAGFAILETDADWAECRETWGTDADFAELENNMELMKTTYIDKGIPVIIGEYGCPKDLKDSEGNVIGQKDPDSVRLFLSSVCREAYERQLCPVLWDITDLHYDRTSCKLIDQELKTLYNEIAASGSEEPTEPTTTTAVTTTITTTTTTEITTVTTTPETTETTEASKTTETSADVTTVTTSAETTASETTASETTTVTSTEIVIITSISETEPTTESVLPLMGDANDDGVLTVADIALLNKYLLGKEVLTEKIYTNTDMNSDSKINIFDEVILKRLLVSLK